MRKYSTLYHDMFKSFKDPNYKIFLKTRAVGEKPYTYDTLLTHPNYNDGKEHIIESYDNLKDAVDAHNYWHSNLTGATEIATNGAIRETELVEITVKTPKPK